MEKGNGKGEKSEQGRVLHSTVAEPSIETIGDGEVEVGVEPSALYEYGFGLFVFGFFSTVGWNLELQACVPLCLLHHYECGEAQGTINNSVTLVLWN